MDEQNEINFLKERIKELEEELSKNKKYGLVWENDTEQIDKLTILEEIQEREIHKSDNKPVNLLIEGDNYYSLQALLKTYKEKVDVIYIDPPYNTGNKEFVYNDKYVDKDGLWRHSKWLSFMNKRLELAKELLAEDGVMFISIDSKELFHLRLLCDEIMGEKNFINLISWINNKNGRQIDKHFATTIDYILVYAKNSDKYILNLEEDKDFDIEKHYKYQDHISVYKRGDFLSNNNSKFNIITRPNLTYAVYYNPITNDAFPVDEKYIDENGKWTFNLDNPYEKEGYVKILPPNREKNGLYGCWRWGMEKFKNEYKEGLMFEVNTKNEWKIYTKNRLSENGIKYKKPKNYIELPGVSGGLELENIFGKKVFNHPKPTKLIKWIIDRHTNKNAIVLDFFAGSVTTGQAVLELNQKDNGRRIFILCTNNENNICEEVTYQRLKYIINGYKNRKGKTIEGIGGNLKYYKIKSSTN